MEGCSEREEGYGVFLVSKIIVENEHGWFSLEDMIGMYPEGSVKRELLHKAFLALKEYFEKEGL